MTKKFTLKALFFAFSILVIGAGSFFIYILANPPYFEQFRTAMEVRQEIIAVLPIGETTVENVLESVEGPRFGSLQCYFFTSQNDVVDLPQESGRIDCQGRKQTLSMWFYRISFYFDDNILENIEVNEIYLGL